jgi:diadenylate cyclase
VEHQGGGATLHNPQIDNLQSSERITRGILQNIESLAYSCGATTIFVYADALDDEPLPVCPELQERTVYVVTSREEHRRREEQGRRCICVPKVPLTRMGQVKIAVFIALLRGRIHRGDVVICLSGTVGSRTLDTISIVSVGGQFEMTVGLPEGDILPSDVEPQVVERVINLASQLGCEGREGKPVGGIFVIGDCDCVRSHSYQLILNPFRGYSEDERNILDPRLEETVKELAALDGAFLIRGDGVIEACGLFLETLCHELSDLPSGLGARHHASAAITTRTQCLAVTISESTGAVSIFRSGKIITTIKRPRGHVTPDRFERNRLDES